MEEGPICIVGAGLAGGRCVAALRQEGYQGELCLIGEETAPPYERPPLSKAYLAGGLEQAKLELHPSQFYSQQGIDWRPRTKVVGLDLAGRRIRLDRGGELGYNLLLLSTGSRARPLRVPGGELAGISTYRDLEDADRLRRELAAGPRVLVVGGGFLGSELAAAARLAGCQVTLVETTERILQGFDEEVSRHCTELHREAGVELLLGQSVARFEGGERVETAQLAQGGSVPCDLVLVCIGAEPRIELARAAGLSVDSGLVTDGRLEAAPGIFAGGDIASWPSRHWGVRLRLEHYDNAQQQGLFLARAMLGDTSQYDPLPYFWTEQYQTLVQHVGIASDGDERVLRGDPRSGRFSIFQLARGTVRSCSAVNRFPDLAAARRLIESGAQVSPEILADPDLDLRDWARQAAAAPN